MKLIPTLIILLDKVCLDLQSNIVTLKVQSSFAHLFVFSCIGKATYGDRQDGLVHEERTVI